MRKKINDMMEPEGWVFFSADFSCVPGNVMLKRDKANTERWHKLSDEEKESAQLYAKARGKTLVEAINRACKIAAAFPPINESVEL